jgi:5-methylcytosine-specific restriction endonuclease McrA
MIFIKRPKAPAFLTDKKGKWYTEIRAAQKHYSKKAKKAYKFKFYNDTALKAELEKVFQNCAYCGTTYGASYDGDVEHFRPKGRVHEKNPQTPGYYWLANDWENLFLACQHCNQRRKHILVGTDKLTGYGKLDQFPLDPESQRMKKPGKLTKEETARLLINPCIDDPAEHLSYEEKECVIVPLTKKGKKSVEVYVLQRPKLVKRRKEQMFRIFKQMEVVKRELQRFNKDKSAAQRKIFKDELDYLMQYTEPEKEYAGVARFFVKKFLRENKIKV